MVLIIFDPDNISRENINNSILNVQDYVISYNSILQLISDGKDIKFIVKNPTILQWFKNMSARYEKGEFTFETIDNRKEIIQRWGVEIPIAVKNEDILQANLLNLDIHPLPGFTFEDTLLEHFYSTFLVSKTFPFTQLVGLLNAVDPEKWKANREIPLLVRTLNKRFEEWKSKARSSEQRYLVELFVLNPQKLKDRLMQFRVLLSYPSVGENLLGNDYGIFKALRLQLDDLGVEEEKIPDAVIQITYYLNNHDPNTPEELAALVETVSGLLSVEFNAIEGYLHDHTEWITPDLQVQLENKFSSLSRHYTQRLSALRGLIRPPKPGVPDMDWDVDAMFNWVVSTYLPYQAWCDAHDQFEPELYQIGDIFSQWLMSHWNNLHANSKRLVFNILPNKAAELKQPGKVNLVLVVDNLGWSFSGMLQDLFLERGFFLSTSEPYLAMLPSETEISKKCLLSGAVGYQAIDDKTYKGIIEKGWVPYFNDIAFRYISDIGSLSTVQTIEASTYVVNYLAVDKALHKSSNEIGMPHREHIRYLLKNLVENVFQFIEKHHLQDSIRIHVISDHGSTRISADIQNDIDPSFFNQNGFDLRSHRFLYIGNEQFAGLADNFKKDCFFLPANEFLNPSNALCARRANRFTSLNKDIYVHGGLLPEEVVVPSMVFEPAAVPLEDLTVILRQHVFRYGLETVELEVGNPNTSIVEQVKTSTMNGNVECSPDIIPLLNGRTNTLVQFKARFSPTSYSEEQHNLRFRFRYNAHGEQHTFDASFNIDMKSMVQEKGADIFED